MYIFVVLTYLREQCLKYKVCGLLLVVGLQKAPFYLLFSSAREVPCLYETCCHGETDGGEKEVCLVAAAVKNMAVQYSDLCERDPP